MANKWVLVEALIQYRIRYMVEVPEEHPEWALDTVTMQEAKEFSQEYLGETILSHRVMDSTAEALVLCDLDNDYCSAWTDEQKMKSFFTTWEEQQPDEMKNKDSVGHSEYYYDTERNK